MKGSLTSRIAKAPEISDGALASRTLESLGVRAGRDKLRDLIARTASNSPYLSRQMEREADFLEQAVDTAPEDAFDALLATLTFAEQPTRQDILARLREVKRRASLLIALADVGGV